MSDSDQNEKNVIKSAIEDYDPFAGLFNPFNNVKQFSSAKPMTSFSTFEPRQINQLLASGYRAYLKMAGVHARISLRSSAKFPVIMVAQNAKDCTDKLSDEIKADLLRIFPSNGRTKIEGFYSIKSAHLYLFDVTEADGEMLLFPFPERWQRLPRLHGSRNITILRLLTDMRAIRAEVRSHSFVPELEGIVLRESRGVISFQERRFRFPLPDVY